MSRLIYIVQLHYSDAEDTCRVFSTRSLAVAAFNRYRSCSYPFLVAVYLKRAELGYSLRGHFAFILDFFRCGK